MDERMNFTFAGYNTGFNRVLKARKKLRDKKIAEKNTEYADLMSNWDYVSPFTPPETRNYIKRIDKLMQVKK